MLSMVESKKNGNYGFWGYANSVTYNSAGAVTSMQLGNGKWESTKFNSLLQPTQIALGTVQNGIDGLKLNFDYGANNNGDVISQTISYQGLTDPFVQSYQYDSLDRLTEARETKGPQETWKQDFGYDRYGNRNQLTQIMSGQQLQNDSVSLPQIDSGLIGLPAEDINTMRTETWSTML
jgi:YD repeat-containing protein